MKALVTGATGFIGAHVARALVEDGADVRSFGRSAPRPEARIAEHVTGDVRDVAALTRAARGCQAVFHLAARYSYARADAGEMSAVNVGGTRNVLVASARAGVRRVVLTSSAGTCGPVPRRPADERDAPPDWELAVPYKRTKLAAERLALEAAADGLGVVVVCPTTTVGPGDRRPTPTGRMILDVMQGRIRGYIAGGGLNVVAVQDVARGHLLAFEHGRSGERYLLGGDNLSMSEALGIVARHAERPAPRLAVPFRVALGAALVARAAGGLTRREPRLLVLDEVRLARLPMWFTSAKASRELGHVWRPADRALAESVAWFAAHA